MHSAMREGGCVYNIPVSGQTLSIGAGGWDLSGITAQTPQAVGVVAPHMFA
jgi:hypothetical protein